LELATLSALVQAAADVGLDTGTVRADLASDKDVALIEQEAQQAAVPVMLLAMSTWLLVNPVLIAPSGRLAVVLSWLPWSSPIIMPMRMGLTSVSPMSVAGSMAVAIAGSVFAVWLSARIYRVGLLMYGKRPSFAELARWVRRA